MTGALQSEAIIRRYFEEVVDGRDPSAVDRLFTTDCRVMRADLGRPMIGRDAVRRFVAASVRAVPFIRTEIEAMVAGVDGHIAVRVRHEARFGPLVITPVGPVLGLDRREPVCWTAMAMFLISDSLIAEEHVVRDEIAILKGMGLSSKLRSMRRRAAADRVREFFGGKGTGPS